jgi:iron complex outermembrane receptor protein
VTKGDVAPAFTSGGQRVVNAGQVLAPYASKQKEIGAKYDGGNLGGGVAFFTTGQPLAYIQNQTYGTYGEQRNQGLEFSVYGEPMKGLRLLGGLTLLDAEQRRTLGGATDGARPSACRRRSSTRRRMGRAGRARPGAQRAPDAHLEAIRQRGQHAACPRGIASTSARATWSTSATAALLTLRGRIDNLFNKSYWASAGGFPGSNYLVQGAPRTFVVSGTIDF